MATLTVRNLDEALVRALEFERPSMGAVQRPSTERSCTKC